MQVADPKGVGGIWNTGPVDRWAFWLPIVFAVLNAITGLLAWSQDDLANAARVGVSTVRDFEAARRRPMRNNLEAICAAIEAAGIEFIPENGGGAGRRLSKRNRNAS